jgi:hypothetical protein
LKLEDGNKCGKKTKVIRISRQSSLQQNMTDQKEVEIVEYFNYLSNLITNDARCHVKLNSGLP